MVIISIKKEEVISYLKQYDLELIGEYVNSNTKLKLKCKNNHILNVSLSDLKRRKNKGCNKCNNDYIELWNSRVNEVYNELTLVKYIEGSLCEFQCSCGKLVPIYYYDVVKGTTKSCGHLKDNQKLPSLIGVKYNKLTAIEELQINNNKQREYLFKCECGRTITREIKEVKRGKIKSCGCMLSDVAGAKATHGLSKDRLYGIHRGMIRRCYTKHDTAYKYYGSRGISICDEWLGDNGVLNFYEWALSNGYDDNLSIDRIDNNGNYEPSNCRWVDIITQANNKSTNIFHTFNNETKTLTEWAKELDLCVDSLWKRIYKYDYSFEKAISYKLHKISKHKSRGN